MGFRKGERMNKTRGTRLFALALFATAGTATLSAQSIYATLTGVVSDPSQAVVAGASVKLRDQQSGSLRDSVTNHDGYYTFASVPVGTYELTVEAKGFETSKAPGIELGGGEKRNVNVSLQVGSATDKVEVTGMADSIVPVDSGEKSETLTTKELQNYVQVGSNAAEYIKIMPGFGISNGTNNKANYSGEVIGINANGDAGSMSPLNGAFSYNGLPGNSLDITADGAHVSDPGCNCDTPVNPNSDMISEFKVMDVELQRREPEGSDGHQHHRQVWRQRVPRFRVLLCARLRFERQRLRSINTDGESQAAKQVLLSRLHHRRTGPDPGNEVQ